MVPRIHLLVIATQKKKEKQNQWTEQWQQQQQCLFLGRLTKFQFVQSIKYVLRTDGGTVVLLAKISRTVGQVHDKYTGCFLKG